MANALEQANLYELTGKDLSVSYSPAGFDGQAQLSYRSAEYDITLRGSDVRTVDTEIGTFVTIDVTFVPDLESVTFSLLVPAVNLRNGAPEAPVSTLGILASARTSIGGPRLVDGQLTTYQTVPLAGTARLVEF